MEENRRPKISLTEQERFPLLKDLSFLYELQQDLYSPNFTFKSGDRLETSHLKALRSYKEQMMNKENIVASTIPKWLQSYLMSCIENVPFYESRSKQFDLNPTIRKDIVRKEPWSFVSDKANLDELLVYHTSGTTGPPMDVNFSPVTQASWIPQIEYVLDHFNIDLSYKNNKVAIALICDQISTITYASLSTYLNGSGILKINLNPKEWKNDEDCVKYLEKYDPEILTGDPISFMSLKEIEPNIKPKALISSALKLMPSVQKDLESYFKCPVIDVYSLTECRNIAYRTEEVFEVLRPDLYLEIFDPIQDEKLPYDSYGEIVISGGNNPFLPLIRYRTGDFGKIKVVNGKQYIYDLEAREPVVFTTGTGKSLNTIDISRAMVDVPIIGFSLRQNKDNSIEFVGWSHDRIRSKIVGLIGELFEMSNKISVTIEEPDKMDHSKKHIQYSRSY